MSKIVDDLADFVAYAAKLDGDEKGEAQVFCDRLFRAFGHAGYKEAGATLEYRIKKASSKGTSFADLIWKPRFLLEMKKGGEKLQLHVRQAFDYWINAVPNRPRYVLLCNFHEIWIYDFDRQLDEPVDRIALKDLPKRYTALNFLFPDERTPQFNNDREVVSRQAADKMADLFKKLTRRTKNAIPREQAQRFVLQLVVAMFAEDIDLLPAGTVKGIYDDCFQRKQSSYDLFGALFRQMNDPNAAKGGRFVGVRYFNGGLFSKIDPIELTVFELDLIGSENPTDQGAALKDWSKVNPAIFGTIFQESMDADARHAFGAHFTSEADIQRIVGPTIVNPWRERIDAATTMKQLIALRRELAAFQVLDPACGSGNFLYVAFRELARLDQRILLRLKALVSSKEFENQSKQLVAISPLQFHGIELDSFGVELAKVSLMIAKKLALDEAVDTLAEGDGEFSKGTAELGFHKYEALPLDNLDINIQCKDALFIEWPKVDAIVGNPPYQSKNKMMPEFGVAYVQKLRERYPSVPGRADYCVYWFKLAHDNLKSGQRAGLVGTNTIRQNYSREGGLDYIVANGGTITEAVSSMIWPGDAVVHVSIVNWLKGKGTGRKRIYIQEGNDKSTGWRHSDFDYIGPSLSFDLDVSKAKRINVNAIMGQCYQGQTHGHKSFLLKPLDAVKIISSDKKYAEVIFPFLIADDLIGEIEAKPTRYVIDFGDRGLVEAQDYPIVLKPVQEKVLPKRKEAAKKEAQKNEEARDANPSAKQSKDHATALESWWLLFRSRGKMITEINKLDRYIACGRVTKRPIFEFVSSAIHPNDALQVFALDDDYSFGILQSGVHWDWFIARCSTLKSDFRYTSNTVFDAFPWPQSPTLKAVQKVAEASIALRQCRAHIRVRRKQSLREMYRTLELPGNHPLKDAQDALDAAVREAYGMPKKADPLAFLLASNLALVAAEKAGNPVQGPGLPAIVKKRAPFVTTDCVSP